DAHTCTNPVYGRGCSLAMVQAVLVTDALAEHPDDGVARAIAYEAASATEVEPWFHHSVMVDEAFGRQQPVSGDEPDSGGRSADGIEALMAASQTDPVLGRAMLRVFNLLLRPDQLMTDPAFVERAMKVFADPDAVPRPERTGPTRDELLENPAA